MSRLSRSISGGPAAASLPSSGALPTSLPLPPPPHRELVFSVVGRCACTCTPGGSRARPCARRVLGVRGRSRACMPDGGQRNGEGREREASRRGNRGKRFPHTTPPQRALLPLPQADTLSPERTPTRRPCANAGRGRTRAYTYVRARTDTRVLATGATLRRYTRRTWDHVTSP